MPTDRAAHTPGPWAVTGLDQHAQRIVKGEHIEICTCWHHSVGALEKQMEANAHLIAAAPDLLAALEFYTHDDIVIGRIVYGKVVCELDGDVPARAAVKKATSHD